MAIGDIYQARIFYNIGSEITENVVHLKEFAACTDPVPAQTVAKIVQSNWTLGYQVGLFSAAAEVVLIQVRRILPSAGVPADLVLGTVINPVIAGLDPGDPVPSMAAALISLYTAQNDRSGRGRVYIPGVSVLQQNDGQLTQGGLDDLGAFADIFATQQPAVIPGTGVFDYAVFSRKLNNANDVIAGVAHSNMATQRSRRNFPGIGT